MSGEANSVSQKLKVYKRSTAKIDASNVQYGIKKLQKLIFDKVHKQGGKQYREASSIDPDKASSRVLIITFMRLQDCV